MTERETTKKDEKPPRRPRRWWRGVVFVLLLVGCVLGVGAYALDGREFAAPVWVQERIAARLEQNAPDIRLRSGEMKISLQRDWRPEVVLRDVEIETAAGAPIAELSRVEAAFSREALLQGQVMARKITLTGIFATLRRDENGAFDLGLSGGGLGVGTSTQHGNSAADLLGQLDVLFQQDAFADLDGITVDAVTLRFEDGRSKRAWTVDGARLGIARVGDALRVTSDLAVLGGGADVATLQATYDSVIGDTAGQFSVAVEDMPARDLADFSPAFGWLAGLRAGISGSMRGAFDATGALEPISASLEIGAGVLQPSAETRPVPFEQASADFTVNPSANELVFDALNVKSEWVSGRAEGRAQLKGVEDGTLDELIGQIRLSDVTINQPDLYPTPMLLSGAQADFRLKPDPFVIDLGQGWLEDQGNSVHLDGRLEAAPDGWHVAVNGQMDRVGKDRLLELWPPDAAPKTRDWLARNLVAGTLSEMEIALRAAPGTDPDLYLGFAFEDAELTYLKDFPAIKDGQGRAALLRDRFSATLSAGFVDASQGGKVNVAGTSFVVPDVRVKSGTPGEVYLKTEGTIEATMALLDLPPTRVASRASLPIDIAQGRARADGVITFPMKKGAPPSDILYDFKGLLTDVRSDKLVEGRTITAERLDVTARNTGVEISGLGRFDGLPADAVWQQDLGPGADRSSTLRATVTLSDEAVKVLKLGLPPGSVTGEGPGALRLDFVPKAPPAFSLTSNLAGVGLRIPQLGWSLAQKSTGSLKVAGQIGTPARVDQLSLDAPGLKATGRVTLAANGGLEAATFDRVQVGAWLDAPVTLRGRGAGRAPGIEISSGRLDLRKMDVASDGSTGGGGDAAPLKLKLDTLQITDTIALTQLQGDFLLGAGMQGKFSSQVNGRAGIAGDVVPVNGRSAYRIRSRNAGRVFSAAGLLKQARDGEMSLVLQPVGTGTDFDGTLKVTNTRVKDAPAMAALLNAVSIIGLLEQLGGQGLHFAEVDAKFRLNSDRVILTQASATGPSIGMSMDGTYDFASARMDMQGVFSPLYLINGIGSVLTRRGEGLIGFNFNLTGPASDPKVRINPLSALTPGFLRQIFRRPTPNVDGGTTTQDPAPKKGGNHFKPDR